VRCHSCPSYRRRSTCMTSRPTLVCLFQATAPPGPPRLPRKEKKNAKFKFAFAVWLSGECSRWGPGGGWSRHEKEAAGDRDMHAMHCNAGGTGSGSRACIHPVWPSDACSSIRRQRCVAGGAKPGAGSRRRPASTCRALAAGSWYMHGCMARLEINTRGKGTAIVGWQPLCVLSIRLWPGDNLGLVWLRVVKFLKRHLSTFEVLNID